MSQKNKATEVKAETKVETEDETKVETKEEKQVSDEGIDRENMTTEEYVEYLEVELGKNIALADENKNTAQRLRADFENYKKRNLTLGQDMKALGETTVLEKILEVLDNLDRAKAMVKDADSLKGFELLVEQLKSILEQFSVKEMEIKTDDEFDPNLMTAVLREENSEKKGKVLDILAKGYLKGDLVLRYAMVKVAG